MGTESQRLAKAGPWAGLIVVLLSVIVSGQNDDKVDYGILFDNTGSMRQVIPREREIAKAVVELAKTKGTFSIYGFASANTKPPLSKFAVGLECSSDAALLSRQLDEISVVGGQTTLIAAINAGAERLKNPVSADCKKSNEKVLIVITDGEDRASNLSTPQLIDSLKLSGVKIYAVGLLEELSSDSGFIQKSPSERAKEFLLRLARETSGRIVLPKKKATAQEIVAKLFTSNYLHPK